MLLAAFGSRAMGRWSMRAAGLALGLLAIGAAALAACDSDQGRDDAFQQVLPLCTELFVHAEGPDASGRADDLSRRIREHSAQFETPAGVHYLRSRLDRETDDVARACIHRLLSDLQEDDG
jgi:hypothetical protein